MREEKLVPANEDPNPWRIFEDNALYMHSRPEILGAKALKEWDKSTEGKKLPRKDGKK